MSPFNDFCWRFLLRKYNQCLRGIVLLIYNIILLRTDMWQTNNCTPCCHDVFSESVGQKPSKTKALQSKYDQVDKRPINLTEWTKALPSNLQGEQKTSHQFIGQTNFTGQTKALPSN